MTVRAGRHTQVKICGIRTLAEAGVALEAGADMLGFVFYRAAARYITPDRVAALVGEVRERFSRAWQAVGVFVNEPLDSLNEILLGCDLDVAQLCGEEPPDYCVRTARPVFKVLRARDNGWSVDRLRHEQMGYEVARFMIDSHVDGFYGGTGVVSDWTTLGGLLDGMILAGGLRPENVASALAVSGAWGVDVSTGVERDGGKDPALVRAFIAAVRRHDQEPGDRDARSAPNQIQKAKRHAQPASVPGGLS